MKHFIHIAIILSFIYITHSYLEFELIRAPHSSKINQKVQKANCTDEKSTNDYQQICYEKDIAYTIELYNDKKELYHLAIDLTTPISWMKGNKCATTSNKKCKLIQGTFKQQLEEEIGQEIEEVQVKVAKKFKKNKPVLGKQQTTSLATISGSSEVIKGNVQKTSNMKFWTRDSGRLTRISDLILLGFYILGEKDQLDITQTNFIVANQISQNMNYINDGAISLRFDQNSEKSFLKEVFNYVQKGSGIKQQIVTVYIGSSHGQNNSLTIGQLSVKSAEGGYTSINWIKAVVDENYGHTPKLNQILITSKQNQERVKEIGIDELYAIFTLSASYVAIPKKQMDKLIGSLSKYAKCSVNQTSLYLQCDYKSNNIDDRQIIFDFQTVKISLDFKDLIFQKANKKVTLLIKQSYKDGYAILGEPIFKKYFMLFDFGKQKIGIAPARLNFNEDFINVITLIRFVTFTFFLGCCFIICFSPVKRLINAFSGRIDKKSAGPQGRRLRQYSPIQDNPYDELKGKIQEVIQSTSGGSSQVQGI